MSASLPAAPRRNLITDVAGITVGNAEDARVRTGVTVIVPKRPVVGAVVVLGGAPGTHETDALDPTCLVDRVDAIVLSGGSAFGLEATAGVMNALAADGAGFKVRGAAVPIVPGAILFDLLNGGDKNWGEIPPYRALGKQAFATAGESFSLGNAGAGYGARAGGLKGGLGSASWSTADGFAVGALVAVNSFGSPLIPGTACFWAGALEQHGEFGARGLPATPTLDLEPDVAKPYFSPMNTTLAVIATNAVLNKTEAKRVALMAHDGIARAIRPAHSPFDGDTVFALATGARAISGANDLFRLGAIAADCLSRAIARGVYEASDLGELRAYRSLAVQR